MKRALMATGVVVVCLPMLFVGWLLLAAQWSRMDAVTMHLPEGFRDVVAQVVMRNAAWEKGGRVKLERATRLNPRNAEAWTGRCTGYFGGTEEAADLQSCRMAVSLSGNPEDYGGLGTAQERAGDACAAEESFSRAASQTSSTDDYEYVERMGRAALRCGHLPAARAGLEVALEKEDKSLKQTNGDPDDDDGTKTNMLKDREFLCIVYAMQHDTLANKMCSDAHPDWKGCNCILDAKGDVSCHEATAAKAGPKPAAR